jgi:hypothetical protein
MCKHNCPGDPQSDLTHCYLECRLTVEVRQWLLSMIKTHDPTVTTNRLLLVLFEGGAVTSALVWIVANTLWFIWDRGKKGKISKLSDCWASLLSDAHLLAETRHKTVALSVINLL